MPDQLSGCRRQWILLLIAIGFFTRIPISTTVPFSKTLLNQANRYFALVGLLVGTLCALILYLAQLVFPLSIAVLLSIAFGILLTGAFHEDGLADLCDGLGGGWQVEQKLNIMKDSRLGTYGLLGLSLALGLKYLALSTLAQHQLNLTLLSLVSIHCVSRAVSASLIFSYPYVQLDQASKVKPLAQQQSMRELLIVIVTAALALLLLPYIAALAIACGALLIRQISGWFLMCQLGGYTGDCLGAVQQVCEVSCYLLLTALFIG